MPVLPAVTNMPAADVKALLSPHMQRLTFNHDSYNGLINSIGDVQVVLIGDGSHGTYEFYAHRANLTKRLIEEKGFNVVAVEADWPDAFRINRYIHNIKLPSDGHLPTALSSLQEFQRFPKWMWKNQVMPSFIDFLKSHNAKVFEESGGDPSRSVSFYGMDLYSLHRSARAVVEYLEIVDPLAAREARIRYNCFERFGEDKSSYAFANQFDLNQSCASHILTVLQSLLANGQSYISSQLASPEHKRLSHPEEEQFVAEMNALVVKNAEEYYRRMMSEYVATWNLRDNHFAHTLQKIHHHLGPSSSDSKTKTREPAKIVVWAHNSHIGDARHTDMGWRRGEINLGQRCREIFGEENVFSLGFLGGRGTVTAARNWDEPPRLYEMNPPFERSIERVFDHSTEEDFYLVMHRIEKDEKGENTKVAVSSRLNEFLNETRYQRFIGVIYRPTTEIPSHYSRCSLAKQYDAVAYLKWSTGIEPLEPEEGWKSAGDLDETFPFGQ
ncbi:hypothetical protein JAAARDRAFT_148566, partial [Jaapia argillacea MUCL 33604]